MRPTIGILSLALAVLLPAAPPPARAAGLRVLSADARGVTLRLDVGPWSLSEPRGDGRASVIGVPDAHSLADPGHALLPAWAGMIAVPLDARPSVRVIASSTAEVREGVRLALAMRPTFRQQPGGEAEPIAEAVPPVLDGLWPREPVLLGAPSPFRGRRLLGVEVRPCQYDEALARLVVTPSITVRVDFNRPAGASSLPVTASAPDPHFDSVLGSSVLNFDQARAWRAAPAADPAAAALFGAGRGARPSAGQAALAFDDTEPEVRVQIDSTGLYLLPFDELSLQGYPTAVPVGQVSVHRHEFIEGAAVPYATLDVPCEVDDVDGDGQFGSGDRIWVYVRTFTERTGASAQQRQWGDAEMIFVTRRASGGTRVPHRAGWRGPSGMVPLTSYPLTTRLERNYTRMMPLVTLPSDTLYDRFQWTDFTMYADRPDTITFDVNDIDTTHSVRVRTGWMGRAVNSHYMWSAVRNPSGAATTVANGDYWFGRTPFVSSGTATGSSLGNGTNRFLTWGRTDASSASANVGLDWFEPTYWRAFRPVRDRIDFNTAGAAGEIQIHAEGFNTDSIRVWDVTVPESPVRVVIDAAHAGAGAFDFQDSVAAGASHVFAAAAVLDPWDPGYGPRVPPSTQFTRVSRDLVHAHTAGDYLLVLGDPSWRDAVQSLVALRQSQNMDVVVTTTQQLYDEFNGGRHSAAAIRRFAKWAYGQWSSRFMLLVGDGTFDPMNGAGTSGTDWVPVITIPGPVSVPEGYEITVSDNAYGCITGNCDPIFGDSTVVPELMIGRLPANSVTDVANMVDKIVGYENLAGDQSWRMHSLLLADDAYSSDAVGVGGGAQRYCWKSWEEYFIGLNNKVRSVMVTEGGLSHMNVERFNLRSYVTTGYVVNGPLDTCRADRNTTRTLVHNSVTPVLFSHINAGTLWMNFQGHANEYVLTHEDVYVNNGDFAGSDDRFQFRNDGKPILWTAFSCHANMFARDQARPGSFLGGCLGEDMVTVPRGGAVATWASSCYEVVPRDDSTHLNVALARALFSVPPQDPDLTDGSRVVLGEAIQAAYIRFLPTVNNYRSERGTALTYTLLGDPAQRISIGQPQTVVRANDTLVVNGQPVRLHSPLDTLTLVADLISTVQIDSIRLFSQVGGAEDRIVLDSAAFVPPYPDTAAGGVSGGRRYRVTYRDHLQRRTHAYLYRITDHDGLDNSFTVQFQLASVLRVNGLPLAELGEVAPNAALSLSLVSPAPVDPTSDLVLLVNGVPQSFQHQPAPGDASGREWTLSWTHPDYALGRFDLALAVADGDTLRHAFQVSSGRLRFANLLTFPNPFDNDGTRFSFNLLGSSAADVRISVLTVSGRRIWSGSWSALASGYHQIPWDGKDAEGSHIANGTYLIHASAIAPDGTRTEQYSRLVKLRRPRHVDVPEPGSTP